MRVVRLACALFGALTIASAQTGSAATPAGAESSANLDPYRAIGAAMARNVGIGNFEWTDAEVEAFIAGVRAAHARQPAPLDASARTLLTELQGRAKQAPASADDEKKDGFLHSARMSAGLQQSKSGLLYRIIVPGAGPRPQVNDTIVANFAAKMPDGKTDLPQLSGKGIRVRVGDMPPGVVEGLQMLALGAHAVFVLPPWLSFGDGPWPEGIARGTPILLTIDLEDIVPGERAP